MVLMSRRISKKLLNLNFRALKNKITQRHTQYQCHFKSEICIFIIFLVSITSVFLVYLKIHRLAFS